ncbi:MAG: hypothetical protein KGZ82_04360 [Bacteroidales bacterium]|nr:hypothetical protein [Bacteroidales bacterium]
MYTQIINNQFSPYLIPGIPTEKVPANTGVFIKRIIDTCSCIYKATDLPEKKRKRDRVDARYMAILLMVFLVGESLSSAAARFKRDHSTAVHGLKIMQRLYQTDPVTRRNLSAALDQLAVQLSARNEIKEFLLSDMTISKFRRFCL